MGTRFQGGFSIAGCGGGYNTFNWIHCFGGHTDYSSIQIQDHVSHIVLVARSPVRCLLVSLSGKFQAIVRAARWTMLVCN